MRKTRVNITKGLTLGSLLYGLATAGVFFGTSQALREVDAEHNLTKEQRVFLNNERLDEYNSSSLPSRIIRLGSFLAYKFYNGSLERELVEGVQK